MSRGLKLFEGFCLRVASRNYVGIENKRNVFIKL